VTEERAMVVSVAGGRATVELEPHEGCGSCGLCLAAGKKMRLELDAIDGVRPGQAVIVAIERSVSFRIAFMLFGLPLVGLVGGVVIGQVWPVPGATVDASSLLCAAALLVAGLFAAILYDRKVARTAPRPTILRIESK